MRTATIKLTEDQLSRIYSALKYREEDSSLVRTLEYELVKLRRENEKATRGETT